MYIYIYIYIKYKPTADHEGKVCGKSFHVEIMQNLLNYIKEP